MGDSDTVKVDDELAEVMLEKTEFVLHTNKMPQTEDDGYEKSSHYLVQDCA